MGKCKSSRHSKSSRRHWLPLHLFPDAMKHIYLIVSLFLKQKINIWFEKLLNNTFEIFSNKFPFCGIIRNLDFPSASVLFFPGTWATNIYSKFIFNSKFPYFIGNIIASYRFCSIHDVNVTCDCYVVAHNTNVWELFVLTVSA